MITFIDKFLRTISGFIKILLFAKLFSLKQFHRPHNNSLKILGNGSSLKDSMISYTESDIMVLNRHVLADDYTIIKPKFYIIADPHFFSHPEGLGILDKISTNTFWGMTLFVPYNSRTKAIVKQHICNKNIDTVFYNTLDFQGFKFVAYKLYKLQLAMPRVQNVLVAAIMVGLLMKYDRIELYGVEHSWTKYLYVGGDNLVYLYNPHFYDKQTIEAKPFKDIHNQSESPFWFVLECYMKMFKSYSIIKDFIQAERIDTQLVNKTENSFIDAFERE